jgi:F-type H+-transporting ATPase subunit gamma
MPRLAELEARVTSIGELDDVVGAMRALAAVRMRQATESMIAARAHAEAIRAAFDAVQALLPEDHARTPPGRQLVVVFCTEHGFAGAFNDRLLDRVNERSDSPVIVVGSRGASLAQERGLNVVASLTAASHPAGVLDVARCTAASITAYLDREHLACVDVIYGCGGGIGAPAIDSLQLLPVIPSPSPPGFPPLHHLDARLLVEQLINELMFAELARIAMEALAAESSARVQAMSAARDNIERKLGDLRRAQHRARQDQITTELLDLITGVQAISSVDPVPSPRHDMRSD